MADGAAEASPGAAQQPDLLSGYATRPPWAVAGVDYAVGVPAGTILKDPMSISEPGVRVDTARHLIWVDDDNVTLEGYDFALEGGWGVYTTAANTVIANCNFQVGTNNLVPIVGGASNRTTPSGVVRNAAW